MIVPNSVPTQPRNSVENGILGWVNVARGNCDRGMPGDPRQVELAPNSTDSNRRIEVALRIEKRFQNMLRQDSSAALMTEGLLGGRLVNIQRGFAGPPINAGEEIRVVPVREVTFTDFLDVLGKKAGCQNEGNSSPDAKSPTTRTKSPTTH